MCVIMNRQKFKYLKCKKTYKQIFKLIKTKIIENKKKKEKIVAIIKPRMGTPTIVLD